MSDETQDFVCGIYLELTMFSEFKKVINFYSQVFLYIGIGPSMEPCGTPEITGLQSETSLLTLTFWRLFDRNDSIH